MCGDVLGSIRQEGGRHIGGGVSDLKFTVITHQGLRRGAVLTLNALISHPWKSTIRKRALRSFI